ncbi:hypothetical protein CALCODRAFT_260711 [Calocera cornea HHB12733]|uniref:Uncharacterized protein n=1 Tax=Calocera cornea HHB12733 TaxID=1353952 RepID=A0A165GIM1_9BASI|nr:hypothetical protein CALCODRAFT_260711 [Calocera cornea HHB12733]
MSRIPVHPQWVSMMNGYRDAGAPEPVRPPHGSYYMGDIRPVLPWAGQFPAPSSYPSHEDLTLPMSTSPHNPDDPQYPFPAEFGAEAINTGGHGQISHPPVTRRPPSWAEYLAILQLASQASGNPNTAGHPSNTPEHSGYYASAPPPMPQYPGADSMLRPWNLQNHPTPAVGLPIQDLRRSRQMALWFPGVVESQDSERGSPPRQSPRSPVGHVYINTLGSVMPSRSASYVPARSPAAQTSVQASPSRHALNTQTRVQYTVADLPVTHSSGAQSKPKSASSGTLAPERLLPSHVEPNPTALTVDELDDGRGQKSEKKEGSALPGPAVLPPVDCEQSKSAVSEGRTAMDTAGHNDIGSSPAVMGPSSNMDHLHALPASTQSSVQTSTTQPERLARDSVSTEDEGHEEGEQSALLASSSSLSSARLEEL